MELTPDITRMFRTKYETKWETQIQQDVELVRPFVTIHPGCFGKSVELPYHGTAKMREYSGRLQKIQWSEMDFGKRSIKPRKFYDSIPLSEDDKLEMGTLDLRASEVMGEQRKACARMHDEVILGVMENDEGDGYRLRTQEDGVCGGILGVNYVGDDGATIETLDASPGSFQLIPADFVAKGTKTASGMLLDKIAELRCRYRQINWKPGKGDDIVVAISPKQHMDLLLMEQTQNRNYGFSSLTNGEVNDFLGVKFLITNMLPLDETGSRLCVAWLKSRVKFGIWKNAAFRIEARSEYVDVQEQITIKAALGATRLDNKTVFLMPCREAA